MPEADTRLYGISEAAKEIGVHPKTLRNWVDRGQVHAVKLPSGYRRFTRAQLVAIKKQIGIDGAAA